MKPLHTTYQYTTLFVAAFISALLIISPVFASSSTIYNNVSVESSTTGGQGQAQVEVTTVTNNNGVISSYHFASSSPDSIQHDATFIQPISSSSNSFNTLPATNIDLSFINQDADTIQNLSDLMHWIQSLRNFLTLYADTTY